MTDIQRAARFFILIKESYGTDLRSFGITSKNMKNAIDYISKVSERLSRVVVENQDFECILKTYDRTDAFFYLDPPYYGTKRCYQYEFSPEEHVRLKNALSKMKGKFLLSYNDCEYIRELYNNYYIVEVERSHNMIKEKEKPYYKELLIKNY